MQPKQRFWEIDFLRGIAIIMMIVFHFLYDLNYFAGKNISVDKGFWLIFGRATAVIFIFLVGVSLTISYSRAKQNKKNTFWKYFKRGATIFGWGLLVTLATWIFLREGFVVFGILQFIGISIVLTYPFLNEKYNKICLWLGIFIIIIGLYLGNMTSNNYWLLPLGIIPSNFYTIDYFPLLPWFGIILIGIFFGYLLYRKNKRMFKLKELGENIFVKPLCFMGRHSLLIYLLHEPVLIGVLKMVGV